MQEFYNELESGNGLVFLKLDPPAEETIATIETILHSNERPSRGRFHASRHTDYRERMVDAHLRDRFMQWASGVWVDGHAATTVPGRMPPAIWPAFRTTICSEPLFTASSLASPPNAPAILRRQP
jgi:hypothetical protein